MSSREPGLTLEATILMVIVVATGVLAVALIGVGAGRLPYYADGIVGVLLLVFALQAIALGKTPVGDFPRRWPVIVLGMLLAGVGIVGSIIPGSLGALPRILLTVCFGLGGAVLLIGLLVDPERGRRWWRLGGARGQLSIACALVYAASIALGVLTWLQDVAALSVVIAGLALYTGGMVYLTAVLTVVYRRYPPQGSAGMTIDRAMLMILGFFMVLLGLLLVPVNLGALPFSPSAQLGLLLLIVALQMLTYGETPLGNFGLTMWALIIGLVLVGLGVFSCIIPDSLTVPLTYLVGSLNAVGGVASLVRVVPTLATPAPPVLRRLRVVQVVVSALTAVFGVAVLVPGLLGGIPLGIVLALNGALVMYLVGLLGSLARAAATGLPDLASRPTIS